MIKMEQIAYHSNPITFGNVVETRQLKVNTDYHSSARRLDTRLHGTQSNERGPFVSTLSNMELEVAFSVRLSALLGRLLRT